MRFLWLPSRLYDVQYFNVDTQDVVARLRAACVPFGPVKFTETTGANPDIYGPFWLCATLVFVIGVTSNMASWLNIREDQVC
jgi:protein YIPF1/2